MTNRELWRSEGPDRLDDPFVVVAEMRRVFSDPGYQPPVLPRIAIEVQQLTTQVSVDFRTILEVLEQDPILAGHVLARAQSPVYATRVPARSLEDAVVRLGLKNIRNIVWEISMKLRVFVAPVYENTLQSVSRHSGATAHIAHLIASRAQIDPGLAFLAGLLHDAGFCACLIVLAEVRHPPPLPLLAMGLDLIHAEASEHLARIWELDEELCLALRAHHTPTANADPLAAIVCLAQHLAGKVGRAIDLHGADFDSTDPSELEAASRQLGITEEQLKAIQTEAEKIAFFTN